MKRNEIHILEAKVKNARKLAMAMSELEYIIEDIDKAIKSNGSIVGITIRPENKLSKSIIIGGIEGHKELSKEFLLKCKASLNLKLLKLKEKLEEL